MLHRDGAEAGLINVFVPFVALTEKNGPTELVPNTHLGQTPPRQEGCGSLRRYFARLHAPGRKPCAPCLSRGEILLFDYRTLHHGLANQSDTARPVGYLVYAREGVRDAHNFPAEVTLREYCARVEATNRRLDASLAAFRGGQAARA